MTQPLSLLQVTPKTGAEPLRCGDVLLKRTVLDFWRWSSSNLVGNALRGIFAEYLVASALGLTETCRVEWDAFDLTTPSGLRIEVKSAAYLQSWQQKALSQIRFGIAPTRAFEKRQTLTLLSRRGRLMCMSFAYCITKTNRRLTRWTWRNGRFIFCLLPL